MEQNFIIKSSLNYLEISPLQTGSLITEYNQLNKGFIVVK